jgi:uncharacterized membrane protein
MTISMMSIDNHDRLYFGGVLLIVLGVVICFLGLLLNFGFLNPDSQNTALGGLIMILGFFAFAVGVGMHYIGSKGISEREARE